MLYMQDTKLVDLLKDLILPNTKETQKNKIFDSI